MSNLETALNHISDQVKRYRTLDPMDGNGMVECLRQIASTLYYLEGERATYHDKWQTIVHQGILKGDSVSGSENKAHLEVPEMYKLRKLMTSAYSVCEAIRTQVSYLKHEMNQSK